MLISSPCASVIYPSWPALLVSILWYLRPIVEITRLNLVVRVTRNLHVDDLVAVANVKILSFSWESQILSLTNFSQHKCINSVIW